MSWIKRNLSLVISGVITLGLLGFGGWYLWSAMQKNQEIDKNINQAKADIDNLLNRDPTPTTSNLYTAKRELDKVQTFITQAKRQFPPTPPPAVPLNNESFKNLLERTIDDLHREASNAPVAIVTSNYFFSFEYWRIPVNFPPESLRPLSERLHEVQTISSILFKSHIKALVSIQRAMVPGERTTGPDYLSRSAHTNAETSTVSWPYEIVFHSFTPELGAVIEGLERGQYGFFIRGIQVEPAFEEKLQQKFPPPPRRTNVLSGTLTTIIEERPLKVVLRLDVIKPETFEPGGPGRFNRPPGSGGPPPNRPRGGQ